MELMRLGDVLCSFWQLWSDGGRMGWTRSWEEWLMRPCRGRIDLLVGAGAAGRPGRLHKVTAVNGQPGASLRNPEHVGAVDRIAPVVVVTYHGSGPPAEQERFATCAAGPWFCGTTADSRERPRSWERS